MRVNSQLLCYSFLLFLSPLAEPQDVRPSKSSEGSKSPEMRLVRPPLWHDHYLEITVKWVTHSKKISYFFFAVYARRQDVLLRD